MVITNLEVVYGASKLLCWNNLNYTFLWCTPTPIFFFSKKSCASLLLFPSLFLWIGHHCNWPAPRNMSLWFNYLAVQLLPYVSIIFIYHFFGRWFWIGKWCQPSWDRSAVPTSQIWSGTLIWPNLETLLWSMCKNSTCNACWLLMSVNIRTNCLVILFISQQVFYW